MTPEQELKLITDRLKIARKGIILFHDPKAQTAAMLPAFCATSATMIIASSRGAGFAWPQSRNQLEKSYNSDN
jgi:hypothetical protein